MRSALRPRPHHDGPGLRRCRAFPPDPLPLLPEPARAVRRPRPSRGPGARGEGPRLCARASRSPACARDRLPYRASSHARASASRPGHGERAQGAAAVPHRRREPAPRDGRPHERGDPRRAPAPHLAAPGPPGRGDVRASFPLVCDQAADRRSRGGRGRARRADLPRSVQREGVMSTKHYALPVGDTRWPVPSSFDTVFNWEYDENRARLLSLYAKGKQKQWDAATRLDWSIEVDPGSEKNGPDDYIPIYGSPTWEKLTEDERRTLRHHMGAWLNSQFLHGEQGALICTAKIVQSVPDIDSKFYAATQVMDEARHVELYDRYLRTKIELVYPINKYLKILLDQVIRDSRWDFTYLGMQVLIEGLALAAFALIRDFSEEPLAKALNTYVMQDEARHVAFGRLALRDYYPQLTDAERAEREEFVVYACYLMRDRFLAEEVWERLGLPLQECLDYVEHSDMLREFRKTLFSRIVPTIKDLGLFGPRVRAAFED